MNRKKAPSLFHWLSWFYKSHICKTNVHKSRKINQIPLILLSPQSWDVAGKWTNLKLSSGSEYLFTVFNYMIISFCTAFFILASYKRASSNGAIVLLHALRIAKTIYKASAPELSRGPAWINSEVSYCIKVPSFFLFPVSLAQIYQIVFGRPA